MFTGNHGRIQFRSGGKIHFSHFGRVEALNGDLYLSASTGHISCESNFDLDANLEYRIGGTKLAVSDLRPVHGIHDEGEVANGTVTLTAAVNVWKLDPTGTPPATAYVPDPTANEGRVLRVLSVGDQPITLKTVSNGSFAGSNNGSMTLNGQKHVTLLSDGTSWYPSQ